MPSAPASSPASWGSVGPARPPSWMCCQAERQVCHVQGLACLGFLLCLKGLLRLATTPSRVCLQAETLFSKLALFPCLCVVVLNFGLEIFPSCCSGILVPCSACLPLSGSMMPGCLSALHWTVRLPHINHSVHCYPACAFGDWGHSTQPLPRPAPHPRFTLPSLPS